MKILFTILAYSLLQLLPLISANPLPAILDKENFFEFYENELNIMAENFCENAKNLSEKLLQDEDIKDASLPEEMEFKIFLQDFVQYYPHFKRFKVYQPLLNKFMNIAKRDNSKDNQESDFKFQQILKNYFANILKEYEQNYKKFINEKLLNKTEDFKNQLSPQDIELMTEFNELFDKLKACQDFQCFPSNSDFLLNVINVTEDVINKSLKIDSKKFHTLICISLNKMGKLILKDEKFSEFSLATQKNLTHDINDYFTRFESSNDIENFGNLVMHKLNFPTKYLNNTYLPVGDGVIFKEIIDKINSNTKTIFEFENKAFFECYTLKMLSAAFLSLEKNELTFNFGKSLNDVKKTLFD